MDNCDSDPVWCLGTGCLEAAEAVPLGLCAVCIVSREAFHQSKMRKEPPEKAQLCGCNKFWVCSCLVSAGEGVMVVGREQDKPSALFAAVGID